MAGAVKAKRTVERLLIEDRPDTQERALEIARNVLRQFDEIFTAHGRTAEDLPTPSRKAYYFLKGVADQLGRNEATLAAVVAAGPMQLTEKSE